MDDVAMAVDRHIADVGFINDGVAGRIEDWKGIAVEIDLELFKVDDDGVFAI
ncbi:MAG: hypothetical protein BWY98_01039 [Tenericutes bacterium ADurb.BinA155]|nr:MAG: hypothetical protein BWY98_01039 [Tenericutes bacterium ADurb.BinA155]